MLHDLSILRAQMPGRSVLPALSRRQLLGTTATVALAAGVMSTAFSRRALAAAGMSDAQKITQIGRAHV